MNTLKSKISFLCRKKGKNDEKDKNILIRNAFLWVYTVIWILFLFVFLFTAVFRVMSFQIQRDDKMILAAVLVSSGNYQPETGDNIVASIGYSNCLGEIMACSGDSITLGTGKTGLVDCVVYHNRRYFSEEELKAVCKDMKVPEGCILLKSSVSENKNFRIGEIVESKEIIGEVYCMVYPFHMLGRTIEELENI